MKGRKGTEMKLAIKITQVADGCRASCPSLPGCVSQGRDQDEAVARVEEMIRGYLASMDVPAEPGSKGPALALLCYA